MAMSEADRSTVTRETNIVFHVAATVRFEEKLSKSIKINVRGTKELMDLAREMEGLESLVHVSTAYVHCHLLNEVIQEKGKRVQIFECMYRGGLKIGPVLISNIQAGPGQNSLQPRANLLPHLCTKNV